MLSDDVLQLAGKHVLHAHGTPRTSSYASYAAENLARLLNVQPCTMPTEDGYQ